MSAINLTTLGCATTPTRPPRPPALDVATPALAIERVSVEPKTIDVKKQDTVRMQFDLTRPARVSVDLVDDEERVARRLEAGERTAGTQTVTWDGRDAEGRPAHQGVYRYVIHAQDAHGFQAVYDPSTETGGEELEPGNFVYDPERGTFSWVMPKAGYARLRVGIEGFPHLRTLLDWEPLEGGAHAIIWNGLDSSGLINLKEHPNLSLKLKAFAMPNNTVIVHGEPPRMTSAARPVSPSMTNGPTAAFHARHPRGACHEIRVRLEFPDARQHDAEGRPVLVGTAPIRMTIDPRDAAWAVNERFELAVFEDLTVIAEEEKGTTPYTYLLDTTTLPSGPHLLTVNVLSGRDHYGVETRQVVIGAQL